MRRALAALLAATLVGSVVFSPVGGAGGAEPELINTPHPQVGLDRLISTSSAFTPQLRDNEGSAYVPADNALWIADDRTDRLFEVDRTSGALRRTIPRSAFVDASRAGGANCSSTPSSCAGLLRNNDLEAIAYDGDADVLYVFSGGPGSLGTWEPTVYRLTRDGNGQFQVRTWRDLPTEWTAAGWRAGDGLYVANLSTIRTYDYVTNTFGPSFSVPGLTRILGIDFEGAAPGDLLAVNNQERLYRVRMDTRVLRQGWNGIDLRPFGLLDTRAVEVIGEQVLVSDGGDENVRPLSDPRSHAVFVLEVTEDTTAPTINIVTPPAAARYGRNQVVPAAFSCADTVGGTGLASCAGTVAPGQPINTATVGQKTFTVTATDEAGNERVVHRTYTVVNVRPDGRIRRGNGPLVGNNVYNGTGVGQTRAGSAARSRNVTFYASVQNDAPVSDRLRLRGQRSTQWFKVVYRGPTGTNITNAVTSGSYRTPNLKSGASRRIKIVVTVRAGAPRGARAVRTLTVLSTIDPAIADTVRFVARRA
jgi:hypothetical protein